MRSSFTNVHRLYPVLELRKHLWGDGARIAIIFGRKQSKEQKKVIASTDVRFSAQIQVKSKKLAFLLIFLP